MSETKQNTDKTAAKDEESSSFTIDTPVPASVSKKHSIIQRKQVVIEKVVPTPTPVPAPAPAATAQVQVATVPTPTPVLPERPKAKSVSEALASSTKNQKTVTVKRVAFRNCREKIHEWNQETIKNSNDPIAKGIREIAKLTSLHALFLKVDDKTLSTGKPTFVADAYYSEASNRVELWQGFHWDPHITLDAWNVFVDQGFVELPPPGTQTNVYSSRNVLRLAFGTRSEECLYLIRCGSLKGCRGVLAVFCEKRIDLKNILIHFFQSLEMIKEKINQVA